LPTVLFFGVAKKVKIVVENNTGLRLEGQQYGGSAPLLLIFFLRHQKPISEQSLV